MNFLDYCLLGFIIIFTFFGWRKGFIQTLGSLVGIVIATILATRFYPLVADYLGSSTWSPTLAFFLIFSLTVKLTGVAFWLFGKIFRIITVLPFISTFDKLLGTILGAVEGILIATLAVYFLSKFSVSPKITLLLKQSLLADVFLTISIVFWPLLPEALKKIKSII
jgi:membrane protein required for colicin V production